jgi:hypothetical protein
MRLGTRSCSECRRRKVRCIFEANAQVCRQCASHGTLCTAQQPSRIQDGQLRQARHAQERLERLEGMIRHISGAIGLDIESSSLAEFETTAKEAFKRLQQPVSPESNEDSGVSGMTAWSSSISPARSDALTSSTDTTHDFEQAPLLELFRAAMLIERDTTQPDRDQTETPADQAVRSCIISLNALLPTDDILTSVLEATEHYWPLWDTFPGHVFSASKGNQSQVSSAKNFILESLGSGCPTTAARAVICLAICMQQLPAKFQHHHRLPIPSNLLVDSYLSGVETLLSLEGTARGIDTVECWPLLAKLYINVGKPRKAWLSCRRAMDMSLILGLDRDRTDLGRSLLWAKIWNAERIIALLTGVPYGIPESHLSLSSGCAHIPNIAMQVMHKIALAAGHINDRNKDPQSASYATILRIEEELRQCKNAMPSEWWDYTAPHMPLDMAYRTTGIKMQFLDMVKALYHPYVHTPVVDEEHAHFKRAGLNTAREMIQEYQNFRHANGTTLIMCDVLDFLAFSSAVMLIINLLSQPAPSVYGQDAIDWDLADVVSKYLNHVSREMECSVASQAARLLDYLSMSYQGTYSGPELYEAVIPYFGKVRIRQVQNARPINSSALDYGQGPPTPPFLNAVEFSANFSTSVAQLGGRDYFTDAELGVDWTSILDMETSNYDWTYVFDSTGLS